jgi:hypothetical protein
MNVDNLSSNFTPLNPPYIDPSMVGEPFVNRKHVKAEEGDTDDVIVKLNGEIVYYCQEAKAGPSGFIIRHKLDSHFRLEYENGRFIMEKLHGNVELFLHKKPETANALASTR